MIAFSNDLLTSPARATTSTSMSVAPHRSASLTIGNAITELEKVVAFIDRFGVDHHVPQPIVRDLNICLDELLNNTISYGYDDKGPHVIALSLWLAGEFLTVEIRDDGRAFDPTVAEAKTPEGTLQTRKVGGLGILFVKTLLDGLKYRREGRHNVLTLEKRLRREKGDGNR